MPKKLNQSNENNIYIPYIIYLFLILLYNSTQRTNTHVHTEVSDYKKFANLRKKIKKSQNSLCETCVHAEFNGNRLVGISLNNITITDLSQSISSFEHIESIRIEQCKINNIENLYSASTRQLNISNCRLQNMPNIKKNFPSLKILTMQSNLISGFLNIDNLNDSIGIVDMSNNKLDGLIYVDRKKRLKFIDISFNNISRIDDINFDCRINTSINISYNSLDKKTLHKKYPCISKFLFTKEILD